MSHYKVWRNKTVTIVFTFLTRAIIAVWPCKYDVKSHVVYTHWMWRKELRCNYDPYLKALAPLLIEKKQKHETLTPDKQNIGLDFATLSRRVEKYIENQANKSIYTLIHSLICAELTTLASSQRVALFTRFSILYAISNFTFILSLICAALPLNIWRTVAASHGLLDSQFYSLLAFKHVWIIAF